MNPKRASVVLSLAGRDAGTIFAVIEIADRDFVLVADGKCRRIESPKKKKVKHLELLAGQLPEIEEKLAAGRLSNSALRKALKEFSAKE